MDSGEKKREKEQKETGKLVRKKGAGEREEFMSHCLTVGCKKSASHVKIPSGHTHPHTKLLQNINLNNSWQNTQTHTY